MLLFAPLSPLTASCVLPSSGSDSVSVCGPGASSTSAGVRFAASFPSMAIHAPIVRQAGTARTLATSTP